MKTIKKIVLSIIMIVVLVIMSGLIYFFFGEKKYTLYKSENLGKIQAVDISAQEFDKNDNPIYDEGVVIYNEDIINQLWKELEDIKLKPYYELSDKEEPSYKGFSITFLTENNQLFNFIASEINNKYIVTINTEDNGVIEENGKSIISLTSINLEDGDRLHNIVKELLKENIRNITVADIEKISKEKDYNWNKYRQFVDISEEMKEEKIKNGVKSSSSSRFNIEGKNGYIVVWYYNGIIVDEKGTNRYAQVCDAIVYNEKGEEMNLYDKGIRTFLEEME